VKRGTRVRMSEQLKKRMRGNCTPTKHVRLHDRGLTSTDYDDPNYVCIFCSNDHVEEFGECVGIVEDPVFPQYPHLEVNVRWQPSNLRYGYLPEDLDVVG